MAMGVCRLCGEVADLQLSHIIPKFAFRWAKDTSATGFFRFSQKPNQRQQDGPKRQWLCERCEALLGKSESEFANKVFRPFCNGETSSIEYQEWMLRLAVSVSWRVALRMSEDGELGHLEDCHHRSLAMAMSRWRAFLLSEVPHPGEFEQHLLPVLELESFSGEAPPPNINRYFLRGFEMDVVNAGPLDGFVYTKIPRFIFLGFFALEHPRQWRSTKINLKEGMIGPRQYDVPGQFGDYLAGRIKNYGLKELGLSVPQQQRIDASIKTNPDRAVASDAFRALHHDVQMFGSELVFGHAKGPIQQDPSNMEDRGSLQDLGEERPSTKNTELDL